MKISYFDDKAITDTALKKTIKSLTSYRANISRIVTESDFSQGESALATYSDEESLAQVYDTASHFKGIKHVILVGIGGQSLGIEAVHSALFDSGPELSVLDTVSSHELLAVMQKINGVKNVSQIAVCISSKSGTTTETLANAATLLDLLEKKFGKRIFKQTVFIGTGDNPVLKFGKKAGGYVLPFQKNIGGRYSVFTAAGLLPLLLLRHDIEGLLEGLEDATSIEFEEAAAESASLLYLYMKVCGVHSTNFFGFDTRLVRLGKWYRQLLAESIGKREKRSGKRNQLSLQPVVSTPVELHSTGQLYFSGFPGVYTDFVRFGERDERDLIVPKKSTLAKIVHIEGATHHDIVEATFEGVAGAYKKMKLPYRDTVLEEERPYALGLFMGMRMLETMYLAELMNVNAFDQPNVELYKNITRDALKKK